MAGKIYIALLAGFLAASAHAGIAIDNFSTGPYSASLSNLASDAALQSAAVPGGTRATQVSITANPLSQTARFDIGSGLLTLNGDTLVRTFSGLAYGFEAAGPDDLNLNLSADDRFRVVFLANDLPLDLTMQVTTNGAVTATAPQVVPGGITSTTAIDIPFSAFAGANFSDIDQIRFMFSTSPSGDFALSNLSTVPEPASLGLFGAGVALLLRRRAR